MNNTSPLSYTLLRRSPILPGESLGSLLARLARLNGYETLNTVMLLVLPELSGRRNYKQENWDNLARPFRARTYERLAALTKLDPVELYKATEHSLGSIVTPPGQELETIFLPEGDSDLQALPIVGNRHVHLHFYTASNAQYCPLCLKNDGVRYHRLIWSAKALAACTQHQVLLVNDCVECHSNLRIRDIVAGCCPECNADLTSATPLSVAGDQLGLLTQTILRAWLSGEPLSSEPATQSLPRASTRAMFQVVYGLANSAVHAATDWSFRHRLPTGNSELLFRRKGPLVASPEHIYRVFATAMNALIDWPTNFYSFLSSYRDQRRGRAATPGGENALITGLGVLSGQRILRDWQGTEFHFVQEAFASFLVENQARFPRVDITARYRNNPAQTNRFEYMSLDEAIRTLDLDRNTIFKLLDAGYLRSATSIQSGRLSFRLIHRADVQSLAKQWKDAGLIHRAHVAKLLGIHWLQINMLRRAGLLTAVRGPQLDGFPFWVYSQDSLSECQGWLSRNITPLTVNPNIAAMVNPTSILDIVHKNRGGIKTLLQAVESGHVRAYLYSKLSSKPPTLYFDEADIRAHFGIAKRRRRNLNP